MRNFVKCFLEIEKDGVCLYSIIDIVCEIVYELDKLCFLTVHLGLVITRPGCTEYDRASISFRRYCANSARRKSPHAQVSSRVIGQAVLRSELRCAAATHWSRHGPYMERGVKLQTKTAAYYYR